MKYTYILWDWNGTLLDDVDASIASINFTLKKEGLPLQTRETYFANFCFPVKNYYEKIGLRFDKRSYEEMAVEFIASFNALLPSIPLHNGAEKLLQAIEAAGLKQGILSASETGLLMQKLKQFDIEKFFTDICSLDNIYAKSKLSLGLSWIGRHDGERVLLIGDTYHDYEVAKAMGVDCVLFCGGHGDRQSLAQCDVPLAKELSELAEYIFAE